MAALAVLLPALPPSKDALAAGSAYVVDTSDVNPPGWCKFDMWYSVARNGDRTAVANPDCVFDLGRPVELNAQFSRTKSDGDWTTTVAPKAKTNIIPSDIGKPGLGISIGATHDMILNQSTALGINLPVTMPFSKEFRVNVNAGWSWDRLVDQHYATYGIGIDWRTPNNVHMLTMEVFGQIGAPQDPSTVIKPGFQVGMRYRPVDQFSVDLIYGRNVYGENSNWITFAVTLRTPSAPTTSPGVE